MYSIDRQTKTVGFDSISYMFVYIVCIDRDKRFNAKPAIYLPLQPATMGFSPAGVQAHWSEPHHRMWAASRRWWWRAWSFGNSDSVNRIYETCINKYSSKTCVLLLLLYLPALFQEFSALPVFDVPRRSWRSLLPEKETEKKKETHINENKSKHSIIACAQIHKHGNIHTHTHAHMHTKCVCIYTHTYIIQICICTGREMCVSYNVGKFENAHYKTIKTIQYSCTIHVYLTINSIFDTLVWRTQTRRK